MLLSFFASAASTIQEGESVVVSNTDGDSYTVSKSKDGCSIKGNNEQSRQKLDEATRDD